MKATVAGLLLVVAAGCSLSLIHLSLHHVGCEMVAAPNNRLKAESVLVTSRPSRQRKPAPVEAARKKSELKSLIRKLADSQIATFRASQGVIPDAATEVRAVIVELGSDRSKFLTEFRWLLRSWVDVRRKELERQKNRPSTDDTILITDLIVHTDTTHSEFVNALKELGCVSGRNRTSRTEPPTCWIQHYVRLPIRAKSQSASSTARDLRHYNYVDSINVVAEFDGFGYDFVLRSDLDCFLTPTWAHTHFRTLRGPAHTILVGEGYYIVDGPQYQTIQHLEYVARQLGLHTPVVNNIGTTWGGPLALARATALLQVQIIRWLDLYEFTAFDRCCAGTSGWPNWHWGVLTLYAGHLAMNNLPHLNRRPGLLDHATTGTTPLNTSEILHLHVLHGNATFSKSEFAAGKYDKLDLTSLDLNTVLGYATYSALEASRLNPEQLARMVSEV